MKAILACASTLVLGFFGYQSQVDSAQEIQETPAVECFADDCSTEDCEILDAVCLPNGDCEITCTDPSGEICTFVLECEDASDCDQADCDQAAACDSSADGNPAADCDQSPNCDSAPSCNSPCDSL